MILMISMIAISTIPSLPVILSSLLVHSWPCAWNSLMTGSFVVAATAIDLLPPDILSPSDYHLVWSDDFDGEKLDSRKWYPLIDCSGRGNNELQCYTNREENVRVRNGQLELMALAEDYSGRNFTSGRVHASGPGWTYGWFEARARLPKGMHLWPAIWLVPTDGVYGPWPQSGEIDMIENRGQNECELESTIHFGSSRSNRKKIGTSMIEFPFDFSQDFHIFGFEWTNQSMKWLLDGVPYFETSTNRFFTDKKERQIYPHKGAPFDQNFKWVLNVAVGGAFFPPSVYGRISRSDAHDWPKPVMEVDWVRVFQKNPAIRTPATATVPAPTTTPVPTSFSVTSPSSLLTTESARETHETTASANQSTSTVASMDESPTTTASAALTTQVSDDGVQQDDSSDKKDGDRGAADKSEEKLINKTKDSEILNEKKMNEVISDPDSNNDNDDIISSGDQRMSPLSSDYYDYYY